MSLAGEIKNKIRGDVADDGATLERYSHDASLFEVTPKVVVYPKDSADIQTLVHFVKSKKGLSITPRGAGTDMSGGAVGESIILDTTKYLNHIVSVNGVKGIVEPGCFYKYFEAETLKYNSLMPSYTASKEICTVGGMLANNSGGEKSIKYGKVENYVQRQKIVLSDGREYEIKPLNKEELNEKIIQGDFEGNIYKRIHELIENNYEILQKAKPAVSKNSAGYYLWNVWDQNKQIFDLNKLIVGAQGTLGITTLIEFGLVNKPKYSRMVVMYLRDIKRLGEIVDTVMTFAPESFESYDDYSMKLAIKFAGDFFKTLGFFGAIRLGLQFIPDILMVLTGGAPKLILMAEVTGDDGTELNHRAIAIKKSVSHFGFKTHVAKTSAEVEKYWRIRRESFNLLRKHTRGKRTAPFIDDVIVSPHALPEFLPKLQKVLDDNKLIYTIAGHAGNGNFHIIPLMDLDNPLSPNLILDVSKKVYELVREYKGSITAEHNDGIIRTPFLSYMYQPVIIDLFSKVKEIFDPDNIFNPGKKVGGSFEYISDHLIKTHNKIHGS